MSGLHTLPDRPVFAFCPACEPVGEPQPIRIVFAGIPGYVPTALVAHSKRSEVGADAGRRKDTLH